MKIMRRRLLPLIGIGVATVASPMMASAGGRFEIAMGETSAAQKPGGSGTGSAVTTCSPYAPLLEATQSSQTSSRAFPGEVTGDRLPARGCNEDWVREIGVGE
jgi:hypothetical protein